MSAEHKLPMRTARRFSVSMHVPQPIYLGLDVKIDNQKNVIEYAICTHDGTYTGDYYVGDIKLAHVPDHKKIAYGQDELIDAIRRYAKTQHYKIQAIGLSLEHNDELVGGFLLNPPSLASKLWFELDAIPFVVNTHGSSLDEHASAAVRKSVIWLSPQYPGSIPRVAVGYRHEVEVDHGSMIKIVDLEHYKRSVSAETWRCLMEIVSEIKERKLKISFFNATPQGGGVALMRHALIRLCKLLGLEVHWYVAKPKPEVFDITKRKFHNVLQGVAPPNIRLMPADMDMFNEWSTQNVERFWGGPNGPLVNSDVIIIDDPQVTGIIPHIRKQNPLCKILYRSHIEIRSDLIRNDPDGPQATTWNFLWGFIKQTDLFIAHPVDNFIPEAVPLVNAVKLPACTDPLDGLNKEMNDWDIEYYRMVFNRVCIDQGASEVNWARPYIVQVARFDPSKGIPDVIHSYKLLRDKLAENPDFSPEMLPQLIICGHGSIDDPDGSVIYEQTYQRIHSEAYCHLASDIIIARVPPCDQLLNAVLRGAYVALQLSHREGFEIKVTESLAKGVPVVAYRAGGIPHQIEHGVTGYLLPIGDTEAVAQTLYNLFANPALRAELSTNAVETLTEEYFTVVNLLSWLFLANETSRNKDLSLGLLGGEETFARNSNIGEAKWVKEFWQAKYNHKGGLKRTRGQKRDVEVVDEEEGELYNVDEVVPVIVDNRDD